MNYLGDGLSIRDVAFGALVLVTAGIVPCRAADLPGRPQAAPAQVSVAPAVQADNLTYDERRTREMYRLVDKLRGTTDPKERRALQLQILPLSGGCVSDMPQPAQAKNP